MRNMDEIIEEEIEWQHCFGLHIRPATMIVKLLKQFPARVLFSHENQTVDAKSILGLLSLHLKKGAKLKITVQGKEAKKTFQVLEASLIKTIREEDEKN